jgi:hypothetical protein
VFIPGPQVAPHIYAAMLVDVLGADPGQAMGGWQGQQIGLEWMALDNVPRQDPVAVPLSSARCWGSLPRPG